MIFRQKRFNVLEISTEYTYLGEALQETQLLFNHIGLNPPPSFPLPNLIREGD